MQISKYRQRKVMHSLEKKPWTWWKLKKKKKKRHTMWRLMSRWDGMRAYKKVFVLPFFVFFGVVGGGFCVYVEGTQVWIWSKMRRTGAWREREDLEEAMRIENIDWSGLCWLVVAWFTLLCFVSHMWSTISDSEQNNKPDMASDQQPIPLIVFGYVPVNLTA